MSSTILHGPRCPNTSSDESGSDASVRSYHSEDFKASDNPHAEAKTAPQKRPLLSITDCIKSTFNTKSTAHTPPPFEIKAELTSETDFAAIHASAKINALKQFLTAHYKAKFTAGNFDGLDFPDAVIDVLRGLASSSGEPRKKDCPLMLITCNAKPHVDEDKFLRLASKCTRKKWLESTQWWLVFEQRSTGPSPDESSDESAQDTTTGIHFHMLIRRGAVSFGQAQREFATTLASVCDTGNRACLNARPVPERDLTKVLTYFSGVKDDKAKAAKSAYDKIWREQMGIDPIYSHDNPCNL